MTDGRDDTVLMDPDRRRRTMAIIAIVTAVLFAITLATPLFLP